MNNTKRTTSKLSDKYKTCDWLYNYGSIGLTKEHIKRLNNAINILESLNEHTDAKSLREIQDKLLEDTPTIKKINTDAFIKKAAEVKEVDFEKELDRIWFDNKLGNYFDNDALDFAHVRTMCKHFFELGLKVNQKGK